MLEIGQRVIVVGTTGAGKSTLAKELAKLLHTPYIELDGLYWEENWRESSDAAFTEKVRNAIHQAGDAWVVDGNYRLSRPIVWPVAETVIWLDYPLWLIYWRLFWRSSKRILTQERLWNNNRESFYSQFLAKDSLFAWAKQTHQGRRETYSRIIANQEYPHLRFLHFRQPRETEFFLRELRKNVQ